MTVETTGNQFAAHMDKLFDKCVLYWPGNLETQSGFSILPSGVTVTPEGTWTDTTLPNGKTVKLFNGSTNYITISDNNAWNFGSDDLTICVSIHFSSISSSFIIPIQIGMVTGTGRTIGIQLNNTGVYWIWSSDGLNWINVESLVSYSFATNTRYSIVIKRSGSTFTLIINGVLLATVTSAVTLYNSTLNLVIGAANNTSGSNYSYYLNGIITDLMIFRRALTIADMKYIMDRTSPYRYGAGLNYPLLYKR